MGRMLKWTPEPFPDSGGLEAEGFISLLGQPVLHPIEILVRETAQNSWDARDEDRTVSMEFAGLELAKGDPRRSALEETIFGERPSESAFPQLHCAFQESSLQVLIIRDTGTHGLGGTTSAAVAVDKSARNRYRRFLLNVGEQGHPEHGGGAYGYGRSICFRVSTCRTAIVYSRTHDDLDAPESRIVSVAYGPAFDLGGRRFNGRHWWNSGDTVGKPIIGPEADVLAEEIGITPFTGSETGTAIAIIAPNFDGEMKRTMRAIALSVALHLWPKYAVIGDSAPAMNFGVSLDGKSVPIPDPGLDQRLTSFVRALALIKEGDVNPTGPSPRGNERLLVIQRRRNATTTAPLGRLATIVHPALPSNSPTDDETDGLAIDVEIETHLNQIANSVALLRSPELVVNYLKVAPHSDENLAIAGVFRGEDGEVNMLLRETEPPAHDDWNELSSNADARKVVKRIRDEIKRFMRDAVDPPPPAILPPADNEKAADIGEALGAELWFEEGYGYGEDRGSDQTAPAGEGGTSGGRKSKATTKKAGALTAPNIEISVAELKDEEPRMNSALRASWSIKFGPVDGPGREHRIALMVLTGDGDSVEVIGEDAELPRIVSIGERHGASKSKSTRKKSTSEWSTEVTLTPDKKGELIVVTVEFFKGTSVLIDVEAV